MAINCSMLIVDPEYLVVSLFLFSLSHRVFLQPSLAVSSQLQATSAHHFLRRPTPQSPPTLTSPTQSIPLSHWDLVKAPLAQLLRALDMSRPHTVLHSGQDPQARARSAYLTPLSP